MVPASYNDIVEKSTGDEVPAALTIFNKAATRLIEEVELSRETVCDLMNLKLRLTRQILGFQGRLE